MIERTVLRLSLFFHFHSIIYPIESISFLFSLNQAKLFFFRSFAYSLFTVFFVLLYKYSLLISPKIICTFILINSVFVSLLLKFLLYPAYVLFNTEARIFTYFFGSCLFFFLGLNLGPWI